MIILSALLGAYLLYLLQNYLYGRFWMKNLSVGISFSEETAIEGQEMSLTETVSNRKWLPLPVIFVKFMTSRNLVFTDRENSVVTDNYYRNDILSVMMYQKITRTLTFRCSHRGYYTINRIDVVGTDLFLSSEKVRSYDLDTHLYVYPKPVEYGRFEVPFQKMLGMVLTKRFINEDPFEFRSIREYQSYDNLKLINWKASAKTNSLMVNVNDYTSSQQVTILLNIRTDTIRYREEIQEESIRIAAAFASEFIKQGIPVSIATNAKDIITQEVLAVPAGSGGSHIRVLMEALARIDTRLETDDFITTARTLFQKSGKNDYFIIIAECLKEGLQELLLSKQQLKVDFSWIIPTNHEQTISVNEELASRVIPWELLQ